MSEPAFAYPAGLRFTCSRCGDCCRGWNVMLGPGEAERLAALEWGDRDRDLEGVTPDSAAPGDAAGRRALTRREDGACTYLGSNNQCRIEERFGHEAKPLLCRMFPFGFFPLDDRLAVDVSFACRAVSEESGKPLTKWVPEWAKLAGEARASTERHPFSRKYDVSGEILWELEHHVVEILSDPSLSLFDRLRSVLEFNRLATTSDPATDAARTLRQVLAKGIRHQIGDRPPEATRMDKTGRAVFFHYLFVAINPTPPSTFELEGKAREKQVRLRVQQADAYKFPESRPLVDNRESPATFSEIANVGADHLATGPGAALLARYLSAKVVGQRFLAEGDSRIPFVEAVPRLVLLAPMAVWTAKALAAERDATAVADSDARRALRLVDRSLGEIRLSLLPPKQRKAWQFVLLETDLPVAAAAEVLHG